MCNTASQGFSTPYPLLWQNIIHICLLQCSIRSRMLSMSLVEKIYNIGKTYTTGTYTLFQKTSIIPKKIVKKTDTITYSRSSHHTLITLVKNTNTPPRLLDIFGGYGTWQQISLILTHPPIPHPPITHTHTNHRHIFNHRHLCHTHKSSEYVGACGRKWWQGWGHVEGFRPMEKCQKGLSKSRARSAGE